jgi:hypothetical protein
MQVWVCPFGLRERKGKVSKKKKMSSPRIGTISIDEYTTQQRKRLDQIKEATAREQAALQRQIEESQRSISHRANSVATNRGGAEYHASNGHRSSVSGGGHHIASAIDDDISHDLRIRSKRLLENERELAAEERALDAAESDLSSKMESIEQKKRELLQRLQRAQQVEHALVEREQRTSRREESTRQKFASLHEKEREQRRSQQLLADEFAERKATLESGRRKVEERQAEEARSLQRLHAQIREMEERLRTGEMQITVKSRTLDDAERDIARDEMKLHDVQLYRIDALRRDIDYRVAALGGGGPAQ